MSITEKTLTKQYPVSLTSTVKELLGSPGIAKQFLATNAELVVQPEELVDPIGDNEHSPVKGLVHRYPDRVLLKPISVCPVYCRFCFRAIIESSPSNVTRFFLPSNIFCP